MTAKALLLDFGAVISITFFESHRQTEQTLGLPAGSLRWRGPFDPDGDALWRAMLCGEISERDYWARRAAQIGRLIGREFDMRALIGATRADDPQRCLRPQALALLRKAKTAGCKVGVLSNELELFYGRQAMARMTFLQELDCLIDASHSDILKPDPRAYRMALRALGVAAGETVFVDDQLRNIEGARACGLQTVHFDVTAPDVSFAKTAHMLGLAEEPLDV